MKNNIISSGCPREPVDDRDFIFEEGLGAGQVMTDEEWEKGFDIEKELGITIPVKDQMGSYSCVGQSWAYYLACLDAKETGIYNENSAKAIYSQISLGQNKGANLRDGAKLAKSWGSVYENIIKSYKEDGTVDETFMRELGWKTEAIDQLAKILQAKDYKLITGIGIDYFARAIKDGFGMVAGVEGTNNGTWLSPNPKPPLSTTLQKDIWGHALFYGKFGVDDKGKWIATPNSLGKSVNGDKTINGWQKIREDYFADENRWVFNPWTLLDKSNLLNNKTMTFKKLVGDKQIWICNEEKKTRCVLIDMPTLAFFSDKFEEVASLDDYQIYGTIALFNRVID